MMGERVVPGRFRCALGECPADSARPSDLQQNLQHNRQGFSHRLRDAKSLVYWWAFRRGELDRAGLQARLDPIARELQGVLEQGNSCADSKAATFCANLLALYPALWLFAAIEGVEPMNNHAERILRLGVLWRKNSFGCHSAAGCRFVERMLTVVQTLRLQKRPVLDYLYRAIVAHRGGLPAPQLLGHPGD